MLSRVSRFSMLVLIGTCFFVVGGSTVGSLVWGQPADADKGKSKSAPKTSTAAAAQFAAKLKEWKDAIKQIREVRTEFKVAEKKDEAALRKKFDDLLAKGRALIPALRQLGIKAYEEAPNQDLSLTLFLVKILSDETGRDAYDSAEELAKTLIDNECVYDEVFELAGVIAFSKDNFDAAEEFFKKAVEKNKLGDDGKKISSSVASYKKFWKDEEEIRKKEKEADDLPRVKLVTTKGEMLIELFENEAPQTVANFIYLVEDKKFYNGLTFHRVLPGFMAQGGCPKGDGTGGPGYNIYCECTKENFRKHFRGTLSMAHAGRNTGGSQFFLTFRPTPHLNGQHTAFGRVISGMDVLAKLQRRNPEDQDPPEPDKIVTATVVRKRDHKYTPTKVED